MNRLRMIRRPAARRSFRANMRASITWLATAMQDLYTRRIGADWRERLTDPGMWVIVLANGDRWIAPPDGFKAFWVLDPEGSEVGDG